MNREKGFSFWYAILCTVLITYGLASSEEQRKSCVPSRCGIITNISHPFRLRDDPPGCGDPIYELICENNVTLLHLYSGTYRVLRIDYNKYKIRLVDAGIQDGDCSSLPRSILSQSNFTDSYDRRNYYKFSYDSSKPYSAGRALGEIMFKHVVYLKCRDPVTDDEAYLDTAPCAVSWEGGGPVYAVAGDLTADQLKSECRVKSVATIASDWESLVGGGRKRSYSYADIHTVLSFGFEISWWKRACADICPHENLCYFNFTIQRPQCGWSPCGSHFWTRFPKCTVMTKLLSGVEDYFLGIAIGVLKLVGYSEVYNARSHFSRGNIAKPLGIITGRFVLPFIPARFLVGIILFSMLLIYTCRRRHLSMYENIEDFIRLHNFLPLRYSFNDLKSITEGFKHKLGQGGFGTVYKGKLKSGIEVAVKMLSNSTKSNSCQDFINEVATIGRIHHFNVVHLVGFCVEGKKRALIYEFMSNGSLDKYIFLKEESISLSYRKLYEISLAVARGIAYLHHGCDMHILHFDIKPHNILLDENFTPKISDFGLAKLYDIDNSIVTLTATRGTIGYMAPELFYNNIGGVSYKADVYSFGMLLMELASRRRNLNPNTEHLSQLYFPLWVYDQFDEMKDIEMEDLTTEEKDLARKMFIAALWCIQLKPIDRPSMNEIIEILEAEEISSLKMPPKPSLYPNETMLADDGSSCSSQTRSITSVRSHSSSGEGTSTGK